MIDFPPSHAPDLPTREDALTWMDTERLSLHAAVDYAAARSRPLPAIVIPAAMHGYLISRGHWDQAAALHRTALQTARAVSDRIGEAGALTDLSDARAPATECQEQALDMYRDLGDRLGEANALGCLGAIRCLTDGYQAGAEHLTQALDLYRDFGNRAGEAETLNVMGEQSLASAGPAVARAYHDKALAIAADIASPLDEARALEGIGRCLLRDDQRDEAATALRGALTTYQRIGSPAAARVQETLRDHGI